MKCKDIPKSIDRITGKIPKVHPESTNLHPRVDIYFIF